jgi:hypothetical protein
LDGFAQAHLVCQDSILPFAPEVCQPVESSELKRLEFAAEVRRLLDDLCVRGTMADGSSRERRASLSQAVVVNDGGIGDVVKF